MDAVAHAIADPVRRAILEAVSREPLSAGEIAALFPISRPAVSRHLRVLRQSGLVTDRVDGRRREYALEPEPLAKITTWIAGLDATAAWNTRLDALDTEVFRTRRERRSHTPEEETA